MDIITDITDCILATREAMHEKDNAVHGGSKV